MLNIPAEVKALFQRDGVHKNFRVHFPNSDMADLTNKNIVQESVVFTESLCSQEYFKFGCAEASQIEFTAVGIPNILGSEMECAIEIDCASLGAAWAAANPPDDSQEWLTPQTYVPDSYRKQKSDYYVSVDISDGEEWTINEVYVPLSYTVSGSDYVAYDEVLVRTSNDPWKATSLGGYIYGGRLEFCSGVLTVTRDCANLWELTWTKGTQPGTGRSWFYTDDLASVIKKPLSTYSVPTAECNVYTVSALSSMGSSAIAISSIDYDQNPGRIYIYDANQTSSTAAQFTTALQTANAKLIYTLEQEQTVQLQTQSWSPITIDKLVWSDIPNSYGEITVDYSVRPISGGLYYRVPYGRFIVDSCPRDHGSMYNRRVVGYTADRFNEVQMFQGQYPTQTLKMNVLDWLNIKCGSTTIPVVKTFDESAEWLRAGLVGADNASRPQLWGVTGIHPAGGVFTAGDLEAPGFVCYLERKKYYIAVDYDPHEYDSYANDFRDAAIATIPTGDYMYFSSYYSSSIRTFKDESTGVSFFANLIKPCFFVSFMYANQGATKGFYRFSKPVFIEPGETYVLDVSDLNSFAFANGISVPSGYSLSSENWAIELHVSIPMQWHKTGQWKWISSSGTETNTTISGWASCAPFDTNVVSRTGTVDVHLVEANSVTTNIPLATVNSTLTVSQGKLGSYYTYYNAISTIGAINGAMEIVGAFWKASRTGGSSIVNISQNQAPITVSRSQWESFWWDENDVDPIGQVNVQFIDEETGEAWVTEFNIGTGESIYVMEDNDVLKNTKDSVAKIRTALNTYFKPNGAAVNFTPVELTMKGLPYLETGDKIELTADDGETLESYVLENRISGIQHLRAEVTSTGGSTLKVVEE